MATNENVYDLASSLRAKSENQRFTLHPLHEAALRLADFGKRKSRSKDLIALLLSHGARAWRQSQPVASIHLHIASHDGHFPVILRTK
jgi:hypothetical protein